MEYAVCSVHVILYSQLIAEYLSVTVGFFDDIYVPLVYLPEPTALYVPELQTSARHELIFAPVTQTHAATRRSVRTSGCQARKPRPRTNCSIRR